VRDAATPQLRALATVGGNLLQRPRCWYFRGQFACWLKGGSECFAREGQSQYAGIFPAGSCVAVHPSDLAPALMALEASLTLQGAASTRTLPVADFFAPPEAQRLVEHRLGTGELLTEVVVPRQPDGTRGVYLKVMERQAWAFALVSVAAVLTLREGRVERARLVLGGVANVPWRVRSIEQALAGQTLTAELAAQAAERAVADAQPLARNGYKVPMARELVRRALLQAAQLAL
jgi:xanthine dehydrogenase YagS FAD-binding subunit